MEPADSRDVLERTTDPPDAVLRYGDHDDAIIDIHLPRHPGPLVILLHGGFWRVAYDRVHTRPLAQALAREGLVVATPEYRRVGGIGPLAGGWPATFDDVGAAVAALPALLEALDVRTTTTTVLGHSAGGHLALWLANEAYPLDRVVALAPVGDLRAAAREGLGVGAVVALLGGSAKEVPERYDAADPATRLARQPACEVVVIHGRLDEVVPVDNSRGLGRRHGFVSVVEVAGIGHFGLIDPLSGAWPLVLSATHEGPVGARRPGPHGHTER